MSKSTLPMPGYLPNTRGRLFNTVGKSPKSDVINGARFQSYDKDTHTVVLRIDHFEIPEFWLEIPVDLNELLKFVKAEQDSALEDEEAASVPRVRAPLFMKREPRQQSTSTPNNSLDNNSEAFKAWPEKQEEWMDTMDLLDNDFH